MKAKAKAEKKNTHQRQKIAVISFDFYSYDSYIVKALHQCDGVEAIHIDYSKIKYQYKNVNEKVYNFYLKNMHRRNLKKEYIEEQIQLQVGEEIYDQILIMRPDRLSIELIERIRTRTQKLICYLYDSSTRMNVDRYMDSSLFDQVFTFDKQDSERYQIPWVSNYIFWEYEKANPEPQYDVFLISSIDERLKALNQLAETLSGQDLKLNFTVVGKLKGKELNPQIINTRVTQTLASVKPIMKDSFALLDLVREGQQGLSFRPFEALALEKKLITNNAIIKEYPFYNPNNIWVLESPEDKIPKSFFDIPYESIPKEIYQEYTVANWVEKVFQLSPNS